MPAIIAAFRAQQYLKLWTVMFRLWPTICKTQKACNGYLFMRFSFVFAWFIQTVEIFWSQCKYILCSRALSPSLSLALFIFPFLSHPNDCLLSTASNAALKQRHNQTMVRTKVWWPKRGNYDGGRGPEKKGERWRCREQTRNEKLKSVAVVN